MSLSGQIDEHAPEKLQNSSFESSQVAGYAGGWANDGCLFEFGGGMLALATVLCVLFCALGMLGGIIGDRGAKKVIAKTGRVSYLLFTLASVILCSSVAALGLGISDLSKDFKGSWSFDTTCPQKN